MDLLTVFSPKDLRSALRLYDWLECNDKGVEYLREYIKKSERVVRVDHSAFSCPQCDKHALAIRGICTPKGKANIYGYKSAWYCEECGYEKHSLKPVAEELQFYYEGET